MENLSPELLLSIAEYLPQIDLLNLSITCKALRAVSKRILHSEYNNRHLFGRPFQDFIKALVDGVVDGKCVKVARIRHWGSLQELGPGFSTRLERKKQEKKMTQSDYKLFTEAAKAVGLIDTIDPWEERSRLLKRIENFIFELTEGFSPDLPPECLYDDEGSHHDEFPFDGKFCQHIRMSVEDAFLLLLLAHLPNLTKLHLLGAAGDSNSLPWTSPTLQMLKLEELYISGVEGPVDFPLAHFDQQIQGPCLRTLEVFAASGWWNGGLAERGDAIRVPLSLPTGCSNISRIKLSFCSLPEADMKSLLEACRAIKTFELIVGGSPVGPTAIKPPALFKLLLSHKDSLEHITYDQSPYDYDEAPGYVYSLTDFKSLKCLDISADAIAGLLDFNPLATPGFEPGERPQPFHQRLPSSIEKLLLHDLDTEICVSQERIRELLTNRSKFTPKLKSVSIISELGDRCQSCYQPEPDAKPLEFRCLKASEYVAEHADAFFTEKGQLTKPAFEMRWIGDRYSEVPQDHRRRIEQNEAFDPHDSDVSRESGDDEVDGHYVLMEEF